MACRAFVALALAVSAGLGVHARGLQGQAPVPAPRPSSIAGRVMDGTTGQPVPAAVVTLGVRGQRQQATTPRVLTDSSGRYVFPEVAKGTYYLDVAKPGWLAGSYGRLRPAGATEPLVVDEGEHRSDVDLRLWRVGVITGRVVDQSGDPLVGVDVRVFQRSFPAGRARWTFVSRAFTDDRGVYRLATLQPGAYVVVVPATITSGPPGLRRGAQPSAHLQTMMAIGTAPVSFEGGDLLAPNGLRLSSALNLTLPPEPDRAWLTYPTTFHPAAGDVTEATVVAVASGEVRAGIDISLRLVPTYEVSGRLVDEAGAPARTHAVHLIPADSADNPVIDTATAVTDDTGAFTFYGVPTGDYVARVVKTPEPGSGMRLSTCSMGGDSISFVCMTGGAGPGPPPPPAGDLFHAEARVAVASRPVRNVAMALSKGARVSGRAEFVGTAKPPQGSALAELSIWLDRADGTTDQPAGGFDPTLPARLTPGLAFVTPSTWPGRHLLRITGIPEGWSLRSAALNGRELADTAFDLRSDMTDVVLTFVDRARTIQGTVSRSGQPDAAAIVLLFPVDADERVDTGRSSRRVQSASTPAGRYSLALPPPGDYLIIAIPDQQATDWRDPAVLLKLAPLAERIRVGADQIPAVALQTRTLR